jgi:DNA polymerase-1
MRAASAPEAAWLVLGRTAAGFAAAALDASGAELGRVDVAGALADFVGTREQEDAPRWVWSDAAAWYGPLLDAGVRVARCHDLRLVHAILRDSALIAQAAELRAAVAWEAGATEAPTPDAALFELEEPPAAGPPEDLDEVLAEFARQRAAIASAADPGRLRLLVAAESAGALIAAELRAAGLPWDVAAHEEILTAVLGERPGSGGLPARVQEAADRVRAALDDPTVSLDSQPKLLRALHRVGVLVESTSRWELAQHEHPVIAPLLEYKRLARLLSANGWSWLDEWVRDGRFRPVYVPAGVVTGRWASSGGGALQLPRLLRAAVRADPRWTLVVADVAQLEPRVLAAMSRDRALAEAARGRDLYAGVVEAGAVPTRADAKVAMLGAMYGATTGDSGRLLPRLRRAYPDAMALVDEAARAGERGGVVSTWLGRSSPPPSESWLRLRQAGAVVDASPTDEARARRAAGDRGRFTRNFVVQGTAAEWALVWLAELRRLLAEVAPVAAADAAPHSGTVFARRPHLAFFLHDEIIVHTPLVHADAVAQAVEDAAATAGRMVFGAFPVDFPLELRITDAADKS